MSRAPDDDIEQYVGDGDWFKFGHQYGVKNITNWELGSWNQSSEWVGHEINLDYQVRVRQLKLRQS